jgi:hypothetical protein
MSLTSKRTATARKRYKPEEIVAKLRQVDVLVSQGQNMVDAIRQIGVSEVTYQRYTEVRCRANRACIASQLPAAIRSTRISSDEVSLPWLQSQARQQRPVATAPAGILKARLPPISAVPLGHEIDQADDNETHIISSQKCSVQLFVWPLRRPPPQIIGKTSECVGVDAPVSCTLSIAPNRPCVSLSMPSVK